MGRTVVYRVLGDICCLGAVCLPSLILFLVGKSFHRGFYCDDESIKHPYKSNTIPTWLAIVFSVSIPPVSIIANETYQLYKGRGTFLDVSKRKLTVTLYRALGSFFFGLAISQLLTDIAKYSIGRLRPHFYTVCKPSVTNCSWETGYIEDYICTGTDKDAINEARLSFPSGHASITMYSMFYLVMYLQNKMRWRKSWFLRPFLQVAIFIIAYYTSLSRVSDYMHHWSDVLGGAILGIVVAVLAIFFISDVMSDVVCCRIVTSSDSSLPLYNTARSDEDRLSVKHSNDSHTSSGGATQNAAPIN